MAVSGAKIGRTQLAEIAGVELRRMRLDAGLSQRAVARLIESHRPIIARVENGRHTPTIETCQLIAAVTGGDLRRLWRAVDRVIGWPKRRRVSARAGRNRAELQP